MVSELGVAAGEADKKESARLAGLRYLVPRGPGIQRRRAGKGFAYVDTRGKAVRDRATLERIRSLVIPPAWKSVWISPYPNTHIQAVGRDGRERKQYRYHPQYRKTRDLVKFDRMRAFGRALPRIRRTVARDLARHGLPKRKVLAAVVKLLESTFIRVGNDEYVEENGSFGLTTLRNQHVQILGGVLEFKFRGKSGQNHDITVEDRRLSRIIGKCREIPGSALFQYLDDEGHHQTIDSGDVNEYLREIGGGEFTAKDFRTWGGTCLAASFLLEKCSASPKGQSKSVLVEVVKEVGSKLGNKPAACKTYYIHPAVMDCYQAGNLTSIASRFCNSRGRHVYEQIVLSLLATAKATIKKNA
jgi:DNA topoisomerase I